MEITFLKPTAKWATTAKSFSSPDRNAKTSDYQLGKYFTYQHKHYATLEEFSQDMNSRDREIVIYGIPTEVLDLTSTECQRLTTNFPYPDTPTLHCFDIDGWKIHDATRKLVEPKLNDPESMGRLVNQMLINEGFDILANADKVVTLSSSMWKLDELNAHVYVEFDAPIRVEAMREFTTALSKLYQKVIFDPAVYKAVQPQFFNSPTCIGFEDPLAGNRIFVVKGGGKVSTEEFQKLINTTLKQIDWSPESSHNLPTIGSNWIGTIENHVNDTNGINEPAYRAAAQLVQSVGRAGVLANINKYAQQMYDAVWTTLTNNGSTRGDSKKDKQTYDVARFRQYLKSATEKNFGDALDQMVSQVTSAIMLEDLGMLTSTAVIHSLAKLKANHYASYLPLEKQIVDTKLLKMGQLNKLIKDGAGAGAEMLEGASIIGSGDSLNHAENMLIDTVLQKYEYIQDRVGNKYAMVPGNGDGGYRMMRVDGELINVFFVDGLEASGNSIGPMFGKRALSKLLGAEQKANTSTFSTYNIGRRVVTEDSRIDGPTWINLGLQADGIHRSARIDTEGVTILTHQQSQVRWMHGVPTLEVASNEQIEARFGENADLLPYLKETLTKFIATASYDTSKLLMWIVSVLANKTNTYIAELTGPTGTGKSTSADLLKDLVDPTTAQLGTGSDRLLFQGVNSDFIASIESSWVTIIDNLSKLTVQQQDVLCAVCSGLKHSERILYTQTQMERTVRRPLIVTCLAPVVTRPDLQSRVVSLELTTPKFDIHFLKAWAKEKPFLRAALMDLTSRTLKLYNEVDGIPAGINTRDIFLASVHSASLGLDYVDYDYVRAFRISEAEDMATDSRFVSLLVRYLADQIGEEENEFRIYTRKFLPTLKRWATDKAGMEVDGYVVNTLDIPQTGRGLGWEMAKHMDVIDKTSEWTVVKDSQGKNGKIYLFTRKQLGLEELI